MKTLRPGHTLPSAAFTVPSRALRRYAPLDRAPEVGDLAYGRIISIGQHQSPKNKQGRIHETHDGTRGDLRLREPLRARCPREVRSVKGQGRCILIDASGQITTAMNSPQMVRGSLIEGEPMRLGIGPEDDA